MGWLDLVCQERVEFHLIPFCGVLKYRGCETDESYDSEEQDMWRGGKGWGGKGSGGKGRGGKGSGGKGRGVSTI